MMVDESSIKYQHSRISCKQITNEMQLVSIGLLTLYMFRTRFVSIFRSRYTKLQMQPPVCVNGCEVVCVC